MGNDKEIKNIQNSLLMKPMNNEDFYIIAIMTSLEHEIECGLYEGMGTENKIKLFTYIHTDIIEKYKFSKEDVQDFQNWKFAKKENPDE